MNEPSKNKELEIQDTQSKTNSFYSFILAVWAIILTHILLLLSGAKRATKEVPELKEPTFEPNYPATGKAPPCCNAAVMVGDIDFFGIPVIAWRNVGREIASDFRSLGFKTTLNLNATRGDVFQALADSGLKVLVIIAHGEKQANTATIYMRGSDAAGLNQYLTAKDVGAQIQTAHGGAHPCLTKVILESCFTGDKTRMPMWQNAFGKKINLTAPSGRTNGIAQYYKYFFKTNYGVVPDKECTNKDGIAPVTGGS